MCCPQVPRKKMGSTGSKLPLGMSIHHPAVPRFKCCLHSTISILLKHTVGRWQEGYKWSGPCYSAERLSLTSEHPPSQHTGMNDDMIYHFTPEKEVLSKGGKWVYLG